MATKLFVGSLAYGVTDQELRELFETIGTVVSAQVIIDRFSNQSKGFAFVEMSSEAEAQKAVKELNGKELQGRAIAISEARPQAPREPRSGGGGFDRRDNQRGGGRDRGRRY